MTDSPHARALRILRRYRNRYADRAAWREANVAKDNAATAFNYAVDELDMTIAFLEGAA